MVKSILVAGEGLAGLVAALACKKAGVEDVGLASLGKGAISIAPGSLDLLGYIDDKVIKSNPLEAVEKLSSKHPYKIIGVETISKSIEFFKEIVEEYLPLYYSPNGENIPALSILGRLKPTFMLPKSHNLHNLDNSKNIAILEIDNLRDFNATFLQNSLAKYSYFQGKKLNVEKIKISEFADAYELNTIDVARRIRKSSILPILKELSNSYDGFIMPTILGIDNHSEIFYALEEEGIKCLELLNIAPAIGGLRIRNALVKACAKIGVSFIENCELTSAEIVGNKCKALHSKAGDILTAEAFIIATGGFLGGGLCLGFDNVLRLSIFNKEIAKIDRAPAEEDLFSNKHHFAYLGVDINDKSLDNLFYAGSILAGYDFAKEKSGSGVAIASGFYAAERVINL